MKCGRENLTSLEPFGATADQQSLAHKGLQKVVEHTLVRVPSRREDHLRGKWRLSLITHNIILNNLCFHCTHLGLLRPDDVDMEYSKRIVAIRLLVSACKLSQVRESVLQIQGQRKLKIIPERSQFRPIGHLTCHLVHGPGAQVDLHQKGEDRKDPTESGNKVEAPPHLNWAKVHGSLIECLSGKFY